MGLRLTEKIMGAMASLRTLYPPLSFALFFLSAWQATTKLTGIPSYLLPPPQAVLASFLSHSSTLITATGETALESLAGLGLALAVAVILALLLFEYRFLDRSVSPYVSIGQSIPLVAVVPLIVVWFGPGLFGRVLMAALVGFFPLLVSLLKGLRSADKDASLLFDLYATRKLDRYRYLLIPSAMPHFLTGLKTGLALSLVGAIVAEFLIPVAGLGEVLVVASYQLDTPLLFAAVAASALLAVIFLLSTDLLDRKLAFWHPSRR